MTDPKYNPNKFGNAKVTHHIIKSYDENGVFFLLGNGCDRHKNCLTCPFPDCIWDNGHFSSSKIMKRGERCTT